MGRVVRQTNLLILKLLFIKVFYYSNRKQINMTTMVEKPKRPSLKPLVTPDPQPGQNDECALHYNKAMRLWDKCSLQLGCAGVESS